MKKKAFDEDYFLRGKETGVSLYENYRWMPELTIPMAQTIAAHCGIEKGARVLDYGCARGYLVKALRGLGYDATGMDISQWALANCDPDVKGYVAQYRLHTTYSWVIAKDVLEHVPNASLAVSGLLRCATQGVFAVVPLSLHDGAPYVVEEYEHDVTHLHRLTLSTWVEMFLQTGWRVEAAYRVPGVKCNYKHFLKGNGFITARRIEE